MKFDETELIEFFGVLPTEQRLEEKEFFGATIFDVSKDNHHLSISFSSYYNDFQLYLRANDLPAPLLYLRLEGVEEIRVGCDKPNSIPALIIKVTGKDEENGKERESQSVEVILEPSMKVKINNRSTW